MISKAESNPTFIKRIITGDEMWVYENDTQSRHQASEWKASNEPRLKKPRRFQSKNKAMLTIFMDYNCMYITNFYQKIRQLIRSIIWTL